MPNGGFWGRIKTGLGLVKQTKNWGSKKHKKAKRHKRYHDDDNADGDGDDGGDIGCAQRLISSEIPIQDNRPCGRPQVADDDDGDGDEIKYHHILKNLIFF